MFFPWDESICAFGKIEICIKKRMISNAPISGAIAVVVPQAIGAFINNLDQHF
jgi:hypothetical protein